MSGWKVLAVACCLVVSAFVLSAAPPSATAVSSMDNYFPMHQDDYWKYEGHVTYEPALGLRRHYHMVLKNEIDGHAHYDDRVWLVLQSEGCMASWAWPPAATRVTSYQARGTSAVVVGRTRKGLTVLEYKLPYLLVLYRQMQMGRTYARTCDYRLKIGVRITRGHITRQITWTNNESVDTPAGKFSSCRKIKVETKIYVRSTRIARAVEYLWLAKGVGPVKSTYWSSTRTGLGTDEIDQSLKLTRRYIH